MTDLSSPLARYTHRLRRQRIIYFSVVTAIVVVVGVIVGVAWSRGEVANTTLVTAAAPPTLRVQAPNQAPAPAWKTTDRVAIGTPQWNGTVVVFGAHTVRGLNARTGAATWSYSRSNRTVCTAAQLGGVTVAVYELAGNCDEVTAVDSGTGKRRWTRTLDMDGMPLFGHPQYQTSTQGTFNTLLVTGESGPSKSVMYAIDTSSGQNRWTYSRFGCAITGAALGTNGALIAQNCVKPNCGKVTLCGTGPQLTLRNAYNPRKDKDEVNPDQIIWNRIGNSDVPVSGDELISAYDAKSGTLRQLDGKNGSVMGTTALSPAPTSGAAIRTTQTTGTELVWAAGVTYAIRGGTDAPIWTARTIGPPTLVANAGSDNPELSTARITVAAPAGAWSLDGNSGRIAQSFSLGPAASSGADAVVYPLGSGFLVTGRSGAAAYR